MNKKVRTTIRFDQIIGCKVVNQETGETVEIQAGPKMFEELVKMGALVPMHRAVSNLRTKAIRRVPKEGRPWLH